MKFNKLLFLISCIFLVGCSNGVSKNQKGDYRNTLQDAYPQYNYYYLNKNNEYEIEFTKDIEEVLIDNNIKKDSIPLFVSSLTKEFTDIQDFYSAVSLTSVFEEDGKNKQDILKKLKVKESLTFSPMDYFTGDMLYMIVNDTYRTYENIETMSPPLIAAPYANKIIRVLTDEPFIFISDNNIQLVQNTKNGVYSLLINDEDTFKFIEKTYSRKDNTEQKNKDISQLLALNEELLISLDAKDIRFPKEELNRRLTILNNFLDKTGIKEHAVTASPLQTYKDSRDSFFYMAALTYAVDNRKSFINDILNYNPLNKVNENEKKIETKVPKPKYDNKEKESIYRLDGVESKYSYDSVIVKEAIKEVSKLSELDIKNNYSVKENEMGQLQINVYSLDIQDEIAETYAFDPYTKDILTKGDSVNSSEESVQNIILEAIEAIEKQTSYSINNQSPYIMSGYVTDEGLIAIDISVSDSNEPGEVIKKDQAIYDPNTHSIKEFSQNSPVEANDTSNEEELIEEAIDKIEQSTGYIRDNPYVYDTYIEDGTVMVEVRAAGAGDSGTMSIVDRFQYVPQNDKIYIYDSGSGRYRPY